MEQVGFCQLGEVQVITSIKGRKCKKQTVMSNICCLFFFWEGGSFILTTCILGQWERVLSEFTGQFLRDCNELLSLKEQSVGKNCPSVWKFKLCLYGVSSNFIGDKGLTIFPLKQHFSEQTMSV